MVFPKFFTRVRTPSAGGARARSGAARTSWNAKSDGTPSALRLRASSIRSSVPPPTEPPIAGNTSGGEGEARVRVSDPNRSGSAGGASRSSERVPRSYASRIDAGTVTGTGTA